MKLRTEHPLVYKGPGDEGWTGLLYCNNDGGAGGTGGGGTGGGTGGEGGAPAAPWAGAGDAMWTIGEGAAAKPWFETIPEGPVKEHVKAKGYANPAQLAMGNYNLTRLHTGNGNVVEIPDDKSTPEQRAQFYTKLGRPADATKYDFTPAWKADVEANKEFKPNEGFVKFGQEMAFELGLSNQQAQTMATKYREYERTQEKAATEAWQKSNDEAVDKLKSVYGDKYDDYLAGGKRAYAGLGLDDATTQSIERNMGSAPLIDLLCRIGKATGEGGFKGGGGGGNGGDPDTMTAEAAAAEIKKLSTDDTFQKAYQNRMDPGHRDAVEKMNKLFARAGDKYQL